MRKKPDLNIELKNFGPITKGAIEIKPLTIFIGPNNSGKSYAAILIHSIYGAAASAIRSYDFHKLCGPGEFNEKITGLIYDLFVKQLKTQIIRAYSAPVGGLIRFGKRLFKLKINSDLLNINLSFQKEKIKIEKGHEKTKAITDRCPDKIYHNLNMDCHYIPAARTGMVQSLKTISAGMVRQAAYVGLKDSGAQTFSGIVSDFIASLIELQPDRKGPFFNLAREFEKELIEGEVVAGSSGSPDYPEIEYLFENHKIPMHRASSTISEMVPLFLYLKHILEPGNILIMEEPEAHLHPANQRILAKYIIRLIRKGLNILITTHSDFLIEQINNFILLSKIDKNRRKKYGYKRDDYININETGAYVFTYDTSSRGYKTEPVEITEEDGISQDEYVKIDEALYEEQFGLMKDIDNT